MSRDNAANFSLGAEALYSTSSSARNGAESRTNTSVYYWHNGDANAAFAASLSDRTFIDFYRATHIVSKVIRLSVMLVICDHIGWVN